MNLNDEENQQYKKFTEYKTNPLRQIKMFQKEIKNISNLQIIGSNGDDLRIRIHYAIMQQQEEIENYEFLIFFKYDQLPKNLI